MFPKNAFSSVLTRKGRVSVDASIKSTGLGEGDVDELFVEVAGEVALERAHGFAGGLSLGDASVEVGAGLGVAATRCSAIVWIALLACRSPPRERR
jgi:hypothetical protein